jgi:hypothetical protein
LQPTSDLGWEETWDAFASIHADDAYANIKWNEQVEKQLQKPAWDQQIEHRALTSLRFGRRSTGPRCWHSTPVRAFARVIKTLLAAASGQPNKRLSTVDVLRRSMLHKENTGDDQHTYELLKIEIEGEKDTQKGTQGYYFYVRATQSLIRDKVLNPAGGVIDSRARQPRVQSRPPPSQASSGSGGGSKGRGSGKKGGSRASSRT